MAQETKNAPVENSLLDSLINIIQSFIEPMIKTNFESTATMLHNGIAYTIIGIIAMWWLFHILKDGIPTREHYFQAGKWIILTIFILAIFSSYNAYLNFISWFMIPTNYVNGVIATTISKATGQDYTNASLGTQLAGFVNYYNLKYEDLWNYGWNNRGYQDLEWIEFFSKISLAYKLSFVSLYGIVLWIVVALASSIIAVSTAIAIILLSFAPIMIPLLMITPLKPYFYSWLKLFISYTLYKSVALIILGFSTSHLKDTFDNTPLGQIFDNTISFFISPILLCFLSIYLFTKIPSWIDNIMATASAGDMQASAGSAMKMVQGGAKFATTGGAANVVSGLASKAAGGSFLKGSMTPALSAIRNSSLGKAAKMGKAIASNKHGTASAG